MRSIFLTFISGLSLGLSACSVPEIEIDSSCAVPDPTFVSEPNKLTAFALKNSGHAGYVNQMVPEQDFELHIVSSYESSGIVNVGKTDKPVVLVLAGYEPGLWEINSARGAKIAKVVTFGYNAQRVDSPLEETRVLSCDEKILSSLGSSTEVNGNTQFMPERYLTGLKHIQSLTNLAESSYQYSYNAGGEFSIPLDLSAAAGPKKEILNASRPSLIREISASDMLERYRTFQSKAPEESQTTIDILIQAMEVGSLPVLRVKKKRGSDGRNAPFDLQPLFPETAIAVTRGEGSISCERRGGRTRLNFVIGSEKRDKTDCSFGDDIHIGRGGRDHLEDSWGDDIFNPGTGNDIIDAGWGGDLIVLEKDWGDDVLHKTCHDGGMDDKNKARLLWPTKYYNFIVFGPGIDPSQLRRESKYVIIYPPTKDKLTLADYCFSMAFTDSRNAIDSYEDIPLLED